jgi:hypothetical protein
VLLVCTVYSELYSEAGYGLDDRGSITGKGKEIFLFSTASRQALGRTQLPIHRVSEDVSPGVKRPEREADHLPTSSVKVMNVGALPPLPHTLSCRGFYLIKHIRCCSVEWGED